MKLLTLKLSALAVVVLGAPMLIPGPGGKPLMSLDDWIPNELIARIRGGVETVSDTVGNLDTDSVAAENTVYRWVDDNGVVHFSDTPVEGAEQATLNDVDMEISSDKFVHHGMIESKKERSGPAAFFLSDKSASTPSVGNGSSTAKSEASLEDIEALIGGDLSRAGNVLGNMPELLEQAKKARQIEPAAR